jgi:hypothetical protein
MKIGVMANDQYMADPSNFKCSAGGRLRFISRSSRPVQTAVQINFGPAEAGQFVLPPWPPQSQPMTAAQQAQSDKIVAMLKRNPAFTGVFDRPRVINTEVQANLEWNESAQLITGWLFFKKTTAKKLVEGRIINDGTGPPYLQLVETGFAPDNQNRGVLMGIYYTMYSDEPSGGLTGDWTLQGAHGSLTLRNN